MGGQRPAPAQGLRGRRVMIIAPATRATRATFPSSPATRATFPRSWENSAKSFAVVERIHNTQRAKLFALHFFHLRLTVLDLPENVNAFCVWVVCPTHPIASRGPRFLCKQSPNRMVPNAARGTGSRIGLAGSIPPLCAAIVGRRAPIARGM